MAKITELPIATSINETDLIPIVQDGITKSIETYLISTAPPSGLESLDEGNGVGWRLAGRDPLNYGPIGFNSVDFSNSTVPSSTAGAVGSYNIINGLDNQVTGGYNYVNGKYNILSSLANGNIVTGSGNDISEGLNSYVTGSGNTISNESGNNIVKGNGNTLNNSIASIVMGDSNNVSTGYSIIIGVGLVSNNFYSTWLGKYNTDNSTIRFGIGNGTGSGTESNLIEIHDNGTVITPSVSEFTIDGEPKALVTRDFLDFIDIELNQFEYTATDGQTVFSGIDNNGRTMSLSKAQNVQLYIQGLIRTDDAATVNSITNTVTTVVGATLGDIVIITESVIKILLPN